MGEFVTLRKEWENWLISAAGALSAMIFLLKNCCPSCREAIFGDSFLGKWGIFLWLWLPIALDIFDLLGCT